jgi:hypothetical protein
MPADLTPIAAPPTTTDPRFQPGAYVTDGEDLYCVQRTRVGPTPASLRVNVLVVEDCRTNLLLELDLQRVDATCTLVRQAPNP